jgi:adenylate kinase
MYVGGISGVGKTTVLRVLESAYGGTASLSVVYMSKEIDVLSASKYGKAFYDMTPAEKLEVHKSLAVKISSTDAQIAILDSHYTHIDESTFRVDCLLSDPMREICNCYVVLRADAKDILDRRINDILKHRNSHDVRTIAKEETIEITEARRVSEETSVHLYIVTNKDVGQTASELRHILRKEYGI